MPVKDLVSRFKELFSKGDDSLQEFLGEFTEADLARLEFIFWSERMDRGDDKDA